jgi:protease I
LLILGGGLPGYYEIHFFVSKVTKELKKYLTELLISGGEKMKEIKVVMIIAKTNFRDEEYLRPKEILTKAGIKVVTASSSLGKAVGMLGATVEVEATIDKINVSDYDGIIFVGGSGAVEYWDNKVAHKIVQETVNQNKVLAAICIAPVTLARAGVLKNKKSTVFPSETAELKNFGAVCTNNKVETDGKIVTASGPEAAVLFGEKIRDLLLKK